MDLPALAQAQNPSTPAPVLAWLSHHDSLEVRAAVASNPNVPPAVLWLLARSHPAAVLRNPCLELLSLEDPLWLQRPEPALLLRLMELPQALVWFVEQVVSGPLPVRLRIAALVRRPDLMWRLVRKAPTEKKLLATLILNPHTPASLLEHLAVEHDMLEEVLQREQRPVYFVEAALDSGRCAAARDPRALARLPRVPAHQLERLASSSDEEVRRAVAASPSCAPELLGRLARDPSLRVRDQVADHERCPWPLALELEQARPLPPEPLPFEP